MVLASNGAPDFKRMVKSQQAGDIVQTSESQGQAATNRASLATGNKTVAVAGTGEQFAALPIPDGFGVVLKALNSNTGPVHIADTKAKSEVDANAYELQPDEFVIIEIDDMDKLFIDANISGNGVTFAIED